MATDKAPPPGARVRIRGEEWAVERVWPVAFGESHAVEVQGLSELVRHHKAVFMTALDDIVELRPEDTRLVSDPSPGYRQTVLYLETLLRRMPPVHDKIAIGHQGALDLMPYQLVPAQRALSSLKPRILLADGTGLGKTVELGILLSELIKRGRGRRILVVAIKSMLAQLQRELWARFTLPLVRLDSEGLLRVQAKIPSNKNPFSYFDRCIVSMDTLKNVGAYRAWLEEIRWDVIVVDECHNVANRGSQRGELARLLSSQCDALVLTSATPHNGRPESFANLMRMLDPTSIADPKSFTKQDVEHLFVRRFKKDVEREAGAQLKDRKLATLSTTATEQEEAALAALHALELTTLSGKQVRHDKLIKWTLIKGFLSSHEACLESLEHRIKATERALVEPAAGPKILVERKVALTKDLASLAAVRELVLAASGQGSRKLEKLLADLEGLGVSAKKGGTRVVIFSERIRTLSMLREILAAQLKLPANAIGVFTASQGGVGADASARDEKAQRALVESFGHKESPLRVLLCSDAASEGVNLHHQCHHLYHYDVPWSLIRLTQRNGRIDRFGQANTPHLSYLLTSSKSQTADQQVTRRLIEKEREVERQLGDPGALLGLYDAELEEEYLTTGVASDEPVDALIPTGPRAPAKPAEETEPEIDLLALFAEVAKEQAATPQVEALTAPSASLFEDDYQLLVAALRHLEESPFVGSEPLQWQTNEQEKTVLVQAPAPFRRFREPFLPFEATPLAKEPYKLVLGRELVASRLFSALEEEGRFPEWQLLWEQHPLVEWLLDALVSAYARGEAPLIRAGALRPHTALYLMQGVLYNHESEAVLARIFAVEADLSTPTPTLKETVLPLEEVLSQSQLRQGLSNSNKPFSQKSALQALLPSVVAKAKAAFEAQRKQQVQAEVVKRVRREERRVEAWVEASRAIVDEQERRWKRDGRKEAPAHIAARLGRQRDDIDKVLREHQQLLRSLKAQDSEPYLRVVAVLVGDR